MMKTSLLLKKLITLFLVLVLPLILISGMTMINYANKLKSETLRSHKNRIQSITTSASTEFDNIIRYSTSISNQSSLSKLCYTTQLLSVYDKVSTINQLREYISNIKLINPLISSIHVYIKSLYQSLNSEGYKSGSVVSFTEEEYLALLPSIRQDALLSFAQQSELKLSLFQSSDHPLYIVEINFSNLQLLKYFENHFSGGLFLIQFANGYQLTNIRDPLLRSTFDDQTNEKPSSFSLHSNEQTYQVLSSPISSANAICYQVIPKNELLGPIRLSFTFTILFFLISMTCILLFFLGAVKLIHKPLIKLVEAFKLLRSGDFSVQIIDQQKNEFSYLYESFNDMSLNLHDLIANDYQKTLLLQTAEFKQLQAQINPHFLYNSFFMLQRMLQRGSFPEAIEVSKELGSYFEYITKNSLQSVPLSDEYEHARIYANIQAMRFQHRISIEVDPIPKEFKDFLVPRLILQPILENAFFYGLENKISNGLLRMRLNPISSMQIMITIEDNGDELKPETLEALSIQLQSIHTQPISGEITGIHNIANRIYLYYKNSSSLQVSRSELGGMRVALLLEKTKEDILCTAY